MRVGSVEADVRVGSVEADMRVGSGGAAAFPVTSALAFAFTSISFAEASKFDSLVSEVLFKEVSTRKRHGSVSLKGDDSNL